MFEPGKCIKCGKCVRITAESDEVPGMVFTGRSFNTAVSTPFGIPVDEALGNLAEKCIVSCPTGALSNSSLPHALNSTR